MRVTAKPSVRRKILVVEDDEDIQNLLFALLTRQGYEVEKADSGLTALASFARSTPDLILLDLAMPDMDGLTFLKRRSQFAKIKDIPVVVISAHDRNTDVIAAINGGADNYITKPFDNAKLIASINRLLGDPRPGAESSTRVSW